MQLTETEKTLLEMFYLLDTTEKDETAIFILLNTEEQQDNLIQFIWEKEFIEKRATMKNEVREEILAEVIRISKETK